MLIINGTYKPRLTLIRPCLLVLSQVESHFRDCTHCLETHCHIARFLQFTSPPIATALCTKTVTRGAYCVRRQVDDERLTTTAIAITASYSAKWTTSELRISHLVYQLYDPNLPCHDPAGVSSSTAMLLAAAAAPAGGGILQFEQPPSRRASDIHLVRV